MFLAKKNKLSSRKELIQTCGWGRSYLKDYTNAVQTAFLKYPITGEQNIKYVYFSFFFYFSHTFKCVNIQNIHLNAGSSTKQREVELF